MPLFPSAKLKSTPPIREPYASNIMGQSSFFDHENRLLSDYHSVALGGMKRTVPASRRLRYSGVLQQLVTGSWMQLINQKRDL